MGKLTDIELFTLLRTKKHNLLHELHFLLNCRQAGVFPRFILQETRMNTNNYYMRRCLHRNRTALLRASIQRTRSMLANNEITLYALHLKLSKTNHGVIWNHIDITSQSTAINLSDVKKMRVNKKLRFLINNQKTWTNNNTQPDREEIPTIIENKSDVTLNDSQRKCLELGLNFAIPPNRTSIEDTICHLENTISNIKSEDAEDIRATLKRVIQSNVDTYKNNRHNPATIIKELTQENIYILKADKGNKTVIVNHKDYEKGMSTLLQNKSVYSELNGNPTTAVTSRVKIALNNSLTLDDTQKRTLMPSNHQLPKIYCVPKIHKPNMPFRPIVSNHGSITQPLAKYVNSKLTYLNNHIQNSISNSTQVIDKLNNITLTPDDILISLDVKDLFTSIPSDEALTALEDKLSHHHKPHLTPLEYHELLNLTKTCIEQPIFQHRNRFYQQKCGLAMGSPLSPILANIFMDKLETQLLSLSHLKPKLWVRYVDDILCIWTHGKDNLEKFLHMANNLHPNISFTIEYEHNNNLPYLDINITRNNDMTFTTSVYRKPYSVCSAPHIQSAHPWIQKMSAFHTLVYRAHIISSNSTCLNTEINHLKKLATYRGYNASIIDRLSKKVYNKLNLLHITTLHTQKLQNNRITILPYIPKLSNKLSQSLKKFNIRTIFKPYRKVDSLTNKYKTKVPPTDTSGVYEISCNDCNDIYIGETRRAFKTRLAEHKRASGVIRNVYHPHKLKPDISAVAKHVSDTNHNINWPNARIIKRCPTYLLKQYEQLHIFKNNAHCMNRKDDFTFPKMWHSIINKNVLT